MKSQKWKVIVIKSPTLRRIRTGLRVLLKEAIYFEFERLGRLRDIYREKRLDGKLVPSQKKREGVIIRKSNDLLQTWTKSILNCAKGSICKSIRQNELSQGVATLSEDMVWNPLQKRWMCINCYNFYYRTEAQKKYLQDLLKQKEEEERAFDEWFSSFISRK